MVYLSPSGHRVMGVGLDLLAPRWLLLLALIPLVWLGRRWSLADLAPLQTALSAVVRSLIVASIALALARPTHVTHADRVSAVFLVDVSHSMADEQIVEARRFIRAALPYARGGATHVVTFASRPRVVHDTEVVRHDTGLDATDIAAAMQLATVLFSPSTVQRLVLLSDGRETHGAALAEAYRAQASGMRIDIATLAVQPQREFVFRRLELPDRITIGRPFELTAEVTASHEEEATLWLDQDELPNPLEPRRVLALHPGQNVLRLRSVVRQGGVVTYRARLSVKGEDRFADNNHQLARAVVVGRPRVLVCDGEPQRAEPFAAALKAENLDVEVRGPEGVPTVLQELRRYDLIVLSDVPMAFLGAQQLATIKAYVQEGGGLLFAAGQSTGVDAEALAGSRLEALLPVRFDSQRKREEPVLALVLVLDKSGSMAGQKIELAKEAARETAALLAPNDLLGVVAFDSQPQTAVRLGRAVARQRIAEDISRIVASGGTNIFPALKEAFAELQPAIARVKHVILLSDGQSAYQGIRELVDEMVQSRMTISTVGVGDGADRTLLADIAEWGGGRFYLTQDAANVPRIFTKETSEVARKTLVEEAVRAQPVKRAQALAGVDFEAAPALGGFVTTTLESTGELLVASQQGEPLLARWHVGLGKVVAWTSDVKARWSAAWMAWPGFRKLWAQIARDTMRLRSAERFDLHAQVQEGIVHVDIDAVDRQARFVNGLNGKVVASDPDHSEQRESFPLRQVAPGRYHAELPQKGHLWSILLRAQLRREKEPVGEAVGAVGAAYSAEYTDVTPNTALLKRLAQISGGRVAVAPAQVFDPRKDSVRFERELWPYALGLAACLLLLDVFLRRVRVLA